MLAVQPGVCSASPSTQVAGLRAVRVWSFTWEQCTASPLVLGHYLG